AAPTNCRRCRAGWVPEPRGCREYHPAWREIFRSQYSFDESAEFIVGRQITIRVGSVAIVRGRRPNVAYWHLADNPTALSFVRFRSTAVHCGNGFDAGFSHYRST